LIVLAGIYAVLRFSIFSLLDGTWVVVSGLAILYVLIPAIVILIIAIFQLPIIIAKFFIFKMAAARVAENKDLIIIGITGSYGKTSTKEFLAQILEKKFEVIKTPKNINTEIGIAKFILQNLIPALSLERRGGKEVFIVEMGAYKKGEIKRICDIVKPKIGIITGINEQHLSLFGSFQNIIDTKYELIEGLPEDGFALFNGENEYCLEMAEKWKGDKVIYKTSPQPSPWKGEGKISLPKHYLLNLAGAVEIARYLGMGEEEIKQATEQIKLTDRMIKTFIGKNRALIIDDSYSANPSGVLAGLDYLAEQKQARKIIIMPCLIELGSAAKEIHQKIGQKINAVCDLAIITTKDYFDIIKAEVGDKAILAAAPEKAIELVKDKLNSDVAVLVEGRVAEFVLSFLQKRESGI